ncbi:MAG: sensor domain-containing diguanylate cyclase [Planctomycetota bacterium]|nr:MAG: sensor domain-containing diguanylate cyclase [Planctomycetota bacterium]
MPSMDLEIYREVVENSLDANYVLDREKMEFVLINPAFEELTGYRAHEVLHGKLRPLEIVHPEDWDVVQSLDAPDQKIYTRKFEFRLLRKDGQIRRVENCVHNIKFHGKSYRVGSMRDITSRVKFEKQLAKEIQTEKIKTHSVVKANVRINQLNERIQKVPQLTTKLLNSKNEEDLLNEAAKMMEERGGLNYRAVKFLIKEGESLVVKYSTLPISKKRYNIHKTSRYAKVFRGRLRGDEGPKDEYILPIQSKEKDLGLLHVFFHPQEVLLFDEQEYIRNMQKDILKTIGNIVGLVIDNLRLLHTIKEQSIMDQLTQTYNRRFFVQKVQEEFRRASRYKRELSLMIIDVDKFKFINDSYGHLQGDLILQNVAKLLKKHLREQDIICRYGGDEFVILMPETGIEGAFQKGEELRQIVESFSFPALEKNRSKLFLSLSIGVSALSHRTHTEEDLFHQADEALYEAKKRGRNLVCCYQPKG